MWDLEKQQWSLMGGLVLREHDLVYEIDMLKTGDSTLVAIGGMLIVCVGVFCCWWCLVCCVA